MTADIISLDARRKPAPDEARQAIRAFINSAVVVGHGDTVSLTVPLAVLDRLMCAAVDGGEGS